MTQGSVDAKVRPGGRVVNYATSTTNDSDVSITVPDGKIWEIFRIFAQLSCSADVGNRTLWITISDATPTRIWNNLKSGSTTATQMVIAESFNLATITTTNTQFSSTLGTNPHVGVRFPLPEKFLLNGGSIIRIYDSAAIAANADDFDLIVVSYIEYDAV